MTLRQEDYICDGGRDRQAVESETDGGNASLAVGELIRWGSAADSTRSHTCQVSSSASEVATVSSSNVHVGVVAGRGREIGAIDGWRTGSIDEDLDNGVAGDDGGSNVARCVGLSGRHSLAKEGRSDGHDTSLRVGKGASGHRACQSGHGRGDTTYRAGICTAASSGSDGDGCIIGSIGGKAESGHADDACNGSCALD